LLENGDVRLVGHPARQFLLDRGRADARGRRTPPAVDDSVIGIQGERPSRIPGVDGLIMFL
jgi:hypothetical protein